MTDTMPAFRVVAWERPAELVEAPVPHAGPGEVVVRVAGNGLCHSDITMQHLSAAHRRSRVLRYWERAPPIHDNC